MPGQAVTGYLREGAGGYRRMCRWGGGTIMGWWGVEVEVCGGESVEVIMGCLGEGG